MSRDSRHASVEESKWYDNNYHLYICPDHKRLCHYPRYYRAHKDQSETGIGRRVGRDKEVERRHQEDNEENMCAHFAINARKLPRPRNSRTLIQPHVPDSHAIEYALQMNCQDRTTRTALLTERQVTLRWIARLERPAGTAGQRILPHLHKPSGVVLSYIGYTTSGLRNKNEALSRRPTRLLREVRRIYMHHLENETVIVPSTGDHKVIKCAKLPDCNVFIFC